MLGVNVKGYAFGAKAAIPAMVSPQHYMIVSVVFSAFCRPYISFTTCPPCRSPAGLVGALSISHRTGRWSQARTRCRYGLLPPDWGTVRHCGGITCGNFYQQSVLCSVVSLLLCDAAATTTPAAFYIDAATNACCCYNHALRALI